VSITPKNIGSINSGEVIRCRSRRHPLPKHANQPLRQSPSPPGRDRKPPRAPANQPASSPASKPARPLPNRSPLKKRINQLKKRKKKPQQQILPQPPSRFPGPLVSNPGSKPAARLPKRRMPGNKFPFKEKKPSAQGSLSPLSGAECTSS